MSDLQKHSERELAEMLQRGDASVMGKLYACYANFLTAVCSRYIIDYEDTRDVLQESFIKIFTKGSSFKYREEGSLKAWLRQIVVNESLTFLKKKERNRLRNGMKTLLHTKKCGSFAVFHWKTSCGMLSVLSGPSV